MSPASSTSMWTGIISPFTSIIWVSWFSISTLMFPLVTGLLRSSVTFTLIVTKPTVLLATVTTVAVSSLLTSNEVWLLAVPTVPYTDVKVATAVTVPSLTVV